MVDTLKIRYPDFGDRLRRRAEQVGVTKSKIKDALKITPEMARRYWEGIAKPRDEKMDLLATLLKMPASVLDRGEYSPSTARPAIGTAQPDLPAEARELAMAWLRLPALKRSLFKQLILLDANAADSGDSIATLPLDEQATHA